MKEAVDAQLDKELGYHTILQRLRDFKILLSDAQADRFLQKYEGYKLDIKFLYFETFIINEKNAPFIKRILTKGLNRTDYKTNSLNPFFPLF